MRTLRVIQTAGGGKNVGFRSLNEIRNLLGDIRGDLENIDNTITALELSAVVIDMNSDGPLAARRTSKSSKTVQLLSAPDAKTIDKNFKIVDDLQEKLKSLDGVLAVLNYQFKGSTEHGKVLRETRTLRTDIESRVKKAYAVINKIAKGNARSDFKELCAEVAEMLFEKMEGAFDKSTQRLFVDTEDEGVVRFTHYIRFENLEDDNGHVYKEYNVVLTHLLGNAIDEFHANSIVDFKVPGRFNTGVHVGDAGGALDILENILLSESFKFILSDNDIPLSKRDVPASKFAHLAKKVTVDDDSLTFEVVKGIPIKKAIDELFIMVKGLMEGKAKGTQIRYSLEGQKVRFFLTNSRPFKLNRTQLRVMQNDLGLTDEQVKRIMQEVL